MVGRNQQVSISRAIAIILMVVGHAGVPGNVFWFIYMFHMPLFFILSGYCFKESSFEDANGYLIKKVKKIYWTYVKYSLLFLVFHNSLYALNVYSVESGGGEYSLKQIVTTVVYIIFTLTGEDQLLGGLWFLRELFFASILSYFVLKNPVHRKFKIGIWVLLTAVFYIFNITIPFIGLNAISFVSTIFVLIGFYLKRIPLDRINNFTTIILCALMTFVGSMFFKQQMNQYNIVTVIPHIMLGLAGTFMIMGISSYLQRFGTCLVSLLAYIGDNSIMILIWHFSCFKLVTLSYILCTGSDLSDLAKFPCLNNHDFLMPIYVFVGCAVPLSIHYLCQFIKKQSS